MKKHQARILLLAAIALPCVGAAAGELVIVCPESIAALESLSAADDAWRVETDLGKRGKFLDSISVFSGPPAEMASLIPDRTSRKKQLRTSTWVFPAQASATYWVACTYSNSTLQLTRQLPGGVRRCELSERLLPNGVRLGIAGMKCEHE
jgi:hypothetical protein